MKREVKQLGLEGNGGHALFFPPALPDRGINKSIQEGEMDVINSAEK